MTYPFRRVVTHQFLNSHTGLFRVLLTALCILLNTVDSETATEQKKNANLFCPILMVLIFL